MTRQALLENNIIGLQWLDCQLIACRTGAIFFAFFRRARASARRARSACPCSPEKRKKITPVLQATCLTFYKISLIIICKLDYQTCDYEKDESFFPFAYKFGMIHNYMKALRDSRPSVFVERFLPPTFQ